MADPMAGTLLSGDRVIINEGSSRLLQDDCRLRCDDVLEVTISCDGMLLAPFKIEGFRARIALQ